MITSSRDEGHFLGQGARAQAVWDPLSQMSGLGKFGSCAVSVSVWEGFTLQGGTLSGAPPKVRGVH